MARQASGADAEETSMPRYTLSPRTGGAVACCLAAGLSLVGPALVVTSAQASAAPVVSAPVVSTSSTSTTSTSTTSTPIAPVVAASGAIAAAPLPDGKGFWTVTSAGVVSAYGAAASLGDLAGRTLNAPVVGIAATPDGNGYWLVASDGGIFSFGDATFHGSTGNLHLNQPIVGMAADGAGGYWLVASDGGIFTFGDATFHGSTGNLHLNQPIVGMAATPTGNGYWLVAADGGIFTFGDATYDGSAAGMLGSGRAVGVVATAGGYWITTFGGGVMSFGDAAVLQSPQQATSSVALGTADPSADTVPTPAYEQACYSATPSASCDSQALALIDSARGGEGLGPLDLPTGYSSLSAPQQLFAVANAERTSRGLPAFSDLTAGLNTLALAGAEATQDPTGPAGVSWAANLAWGVATPLAADFEWMYDDGEGSSNVDCTPSDTSGCWGHRHDILVPWGGSMGAAEAVVQNRISLTELFAEE
jgi:hypothetical protein